MAICEICTNKFRKGYKDKIEICAQCRENIKNELPDCTLNMDDIVKFPGVSQMDTYVSDDGEAKYLEIKYKKLSFLLF